MFFGSAFLYMAIEVDGRIEDLSWIKNGGQGADIFQVVDVVRATGAGQILRMQVVDDFIESFHEAVLVALDELQHVGRRWDIWIRGVFLESGVGLVEFNDEPVSKDYADAVLAIDLEGPDFEGFSDLWMVAM